MDRTVRVFAPHALLRRPGGLYFKIERGLGGGSMGEVYVVRDGNLANRLRVIKVLQSDRATNPDAVERFLREARAMARLRHPNIVGIEDIGMLEDERGRPTLPYYVMPFVEGESLRALLERRTKLEPGHALDLIRQAASGLAAMHAAGVLHCDIKPDNLVVAKADGALVVIDFGVMHLEVEGAREGFFGTYAYASDHQVQGLTPRREDDLFSLSMVLYELVTGVRPFAEHGGGAKGAVARLGKQAIPLRERGIEHAILETLVERGIHPDASKRWTDAESMMRSVKHVRTLFVDARKAVKAAPSVHQQTTRIAPIAVKITPTDLADPTRPNGIDPNAIATVVPRAKEETPTRISARAPVELPPPFSEAKAEAEAKVEAPPKRPRARFDVAVLALSVAVLTAAVAGAGWVVGGSRDATPRRVVAVVVEAPPVASSSAPPIEVAAVIASAAPVASASSSPTTPAPKAPSSPMGTTQKRHTAPSSVPQNIGPSLAAQSGLFDPWAAPSAQSSYPLPK